MNPEDDGKTEEATAKRITEARNKGDVSRSPDLTSAATLLLAAALMPFFQERTLSLLSNNMTSAFLLISEWENIPTNIAPMMLQLFQDVLWIMLPLIGILGLLSMIQQSGQVGWLWAGESITFNLSTLFNLNNLKRMVNVEAWFEMFKSMLKMILVGLIGWHVVSRHWGEYFDSMHWSPGAIYNLVYRVTIEILWKCGLLLLIIGVWDYWFKRKRWKKKLMMTKQEVKDEMKQQDGDPRLKGKIKNLRREMHGRMMMSQIPTATVVITNPTFIAIALRYEPGTDTAPVVLAKGKRLIAEKIRDQAKAHGIPIVEDKPLARGLFDVVYPGEPIPSEFFAAVAEILAYVLGLKEKDPASIS